MNSVRRNLGLILMALAGVIAFLATKMAASGGWEHWGFMTGVAISGIVATGVALVLASSFLTTTGDLWDTSWFRRMRKLYGDSFGGPAEVADFTSEVMVPTRLQISLCRAVNLSTFALLAYAVLACLAVAAIGFVIGSIGTVEYLAGVGAIYGTETPLNFLADQGLGRGAHIGGFLFAGGILFQLCAAFGMYIVIEFFLGVMLKKSREVMNKAWWVWGSITVANSILIFLVTPVRTFGVIPSLTWLGIVLLGIVGLVLAIALFALTIWGVVKLSKTLSRKTVPGVLIRARPRKSVERTGVPDH